MIFLVDLCSLEEGALCDVRKICRAVPPLEYMEIIRTLKDIREGRKRFEIHDEYIGDRPYRQLEKYMPELEFIDDFRFKVVKNPVYHHFTPSMKLAVFLDRMDAMDKKSAVSVPSKYKVGDYKKTIGVEFGVDDRGRFFFLRTSRIIAKIYHLVSVLIHEEKELEDLLVLTEKEKGDWTEETLGSAEFMSKL